jgi:hypothetical protein
MAGDWIKFEVTTPEKEEIYQIAAELEITADEVIGKLMRVWIWFDQHTENGNASVTVQALLDSKAGVTGFCKAMQSVGWMEIEGERLILPHYEYHNGKTAKNRAVTNRRVAKSREMKRSGNDECNDKCNADTVTNIVTREEKRREEEVPPKSPKGESGSRSPKTRYTDEFETFWKCYPNKTGKDAAFSAWKKRKKQGDLPRLPELTEKLESLKATEQWKKECGQYVPNPSTWINQGRWHDEIKHQPTDHGQSPDPEKLQSRHNPRCWLYKSEWPIVQAHIDRHQNDMHPKTYELAKMEFAKMAPGMQDDIAEMAFQHRTGLEMKLP